MCVDRLGNPARHRYAITDGQFLESQPAIQRHERMIGSCLDLATRGEPDLEDFLAATREDVRHRSCNYPLALIERPHQRMLAGLQQVSERDLGAVVCPQYSGVRGETSRLTQV